MSCPDTVKRLSIGKLIEGFSGVEGLLESDYLRSGLERLRVEIKE